MAYPDMFKFYNLSQKTRHQTLAYNFTKFTNRFSNFFH